MYSFVSVCLPPLGHKLHPPNWTMSGKQPIVSKLNCVLIEWVEKCVWSGGGLCLNVPCPDGVHGRTLNCFSPCDCTLPNSFSGGHGNSLIVIPAVHFVLPSLWGGSELSQGPRQLSLQELALQHLHRGNVTFNSIVFNVWVEFSSFLEINLLKSLGIVCF